MISRNSLRAGAAENIENGGHPPDKTVKRFKRPTFSVTAYTDVRLFCQYKQTVRPARERRFDSGTGQSRCFLHEEVKMKEQVKKKIKKLLALSKSPNENEAMAALEKARKLMEENGLTEQDCVVCTSETKALKSRPLWRDVIAMDVAWVNGSVVRIINDCDTRVIRFHGAETDVFIAKEMYEYLIKTVNRMAKQNIRKNAKKPFIDSYKFGIASSLSERIKKAGARYSWANKRIERLTAIGNYVDKLYEAGYKRCSFSTKQEKTNYTAYSRGFSAGKRINLNRQATGKTQKCING